MYSILNRRILHLINKEYQFIWSIKKIIIHYPNSKLRRYVNKIKHGRLSIYYGYRRARKKKFFNGQIKEQKVNHFIKCNTIINCYLSKIHGKLSQFKSKNTLFFLGQTLYLIDLLQPNSSRKKKKNNF